MRRPLPTLVSYFVSSSSVPFFRSPRVAPPPTTIPASPVLRFAASLRLFEWGANASCLVKLNRPKQPMCLQKGASRLSLVPFHLLHSVGPLVSSARRRFSSPSITNFCLSSSRAVLCVQHLQAAVSVLRQSGAALRSSKLLLCLTHYTAAIDLSGTFSDSI